MNDASRQPLFAIALPGVPAPACCVYEEGPLADGSRLLPFDVVTGGCGMHDLDAGTIHVFGDDETIVQEGAIVWTGRSLTLDDDVASVRPDDPSHPAGDVILYADWFHSTPRASWARGIVDMADMRDEDPPEPDEDAAYEAANDPERIALARAYAS